MTTEELQKLRTDLVQEMQTIEAELGRFTTKNPVVKDDYQSLYPKDEEATTSDEDAQKVTNYENERAVEQNLEVRLKALKETLRKIDEGNYGLCAKCNNSIEVKRLTALPAVSLCSSCAKMAKLL